MISPIAKFALAMAGAIQDICDALEETTSPAVQQDLFDIMNKIRAAEAEFRATGGAE